MTPSDAGLSSNASGLFPSLELGDPRLELLHSGDPDLARLLTGFKDEPAMFAGGLAQLLQQVRSSLERAAREQEDAGGASMGE